MRCGAEGGQVTAAIIRQALVDWEALGASATAFNRESVAAIFGRLRDGLDAAKAADNMALCLDMLRADLIAAGVIDPVAPMFMTEAILGAIQSERSKVAQRCAEIAGELFTEAMADEIEKTIRREFPAPARPADDSVPPVDGVSDSRCEYLAAPGQLCNKCGRIHIGEVLKALLASDHLGPERGR